MKDRIIHIQKALSEGLRYDQRRLDEFRKIEIQYGVSATAEGSAKVKIGDTEVIAGVKMSIEKPYPDTPERGNISVNLELLPLSSPEFEAGPPGNLAIEIARVVDRGIRESDVLDLKKLCITPGEQVWTLFIDICSLNDDGNLLDAASLAAFAAIKDAKFPEVEGGVLDYKHKSSKTVQYSDIPIEVTVFRFGKHYLVDPTTEEEKLYDARLTVATLSDGKICALQKGGDGTFTIEDIDKMVTLAIEKGKEIREQVK